MGIGNKSKSVTLQKTNIYIFESKCFFLTEIGFWKEGVLENIMKKFEVDCVYIDNPYFTIIPSEIWNYTSEKYKKEVAANNKNLQYIASKNNSIESYIYWGNAIEVHKKIQNNSPQSTIKHFSESMIGFINKSKNLKIFHGDKTLYISSFSDGKLTLVNRFNVESMDDSLYYFLSVVKESNFVAHEFNLEYMGIEKKPLISKIKELFPRVKFSFLKETDYKNN